MIKQEKDYIKKQKKKYSLYTIIWIGVVLAVFGFGIMLTGERANLFTIIAGFLVIGLALSLSRLCVYLRFKDGNSNYATLIENMKGSYNVFHSAIIPNSQVTILIEHIIVTSRSIYFVVYNEEVLKKHRLWLENRLLAKGLNLKQLHVVQVAHENSMKNIITKIEKDACFTSENLDEYTKRIEELII